MKFIVLFLVPFLLISLTKAQVAPYIPILEDVRNGPNPDGSYYFRYATANGIFREEQAIPTGPNTFTVTGSYTYTSPNGEIIEMQYIADENGYRAFPAGRAPASLIVPVPRPSTRPSIQNLQIEEQIGFGGQVENLFSAQSLTPFSGRRQQVQTPARQNQSQRPQLINRTNNPTFGQNIKQRPRTGVRQRRPLLPNQLSNRQQNFQNRQSQLSNQQQQQNFQNRQNFQSQQDFQNRQNFQQNLQNQGNLDSNFAASNQQRQNIPQGYYNEARY